MHPYGAHAAHDRPRAFLRRLTAPSEDLVALGDLKAHLNLEDDDDNDYVQALGDAGTAWLDGSQGILRRALVSQSWAADYDRFPWGDRLELPLPRLISVEHVKYYDAAGVLQTLDPSAYLVHPGEFGEIEVAPSTRWAQTQRRGRAISVEFTCGFGAASDVPAGIKHAHKLLVSHWFENREAVVGVENRDSSNPLPLGVDALLTPHKVFRF